MPLPTTAAGMHALGKFKRPACLVSLQTTERVEARRIEQIGTVAMILLALLTIGLLLLSPLTDDSRAMSLRLQNALASTPASR